jgi:phospholipid-binding lipoprotein MlaA
MKTVKWIFILPILSACFVSAPCFGEELILSDPIQIKGNVTFQAELGLDELKEVEEPYREEEEEDWQYLEEEELDEISDPLEPINRVFFNFNDKLYFWVLKPVAKGYSTVVPEDIRISVRNFFDNIATPIRVVNNLLQLKIKSAGQEILRFSINSTFGMLGLYDVAKDEMGIKMQDEDFGQTLGIWGLGPGFYINWPLLGPSSVRDSIGFAGDYVLDPVNYISPQIDRYAVRVGDNVNKTSLSIGDYEEIKKDALDPYAAVKDIYYQYRQNKIEK